MPSHKQKNAILALTPTLNLTQTVTIALINPKVNPNLTIKSKPQLTTNNNLKNKRVFEQMSTHSCSLILSNQSSFARLSEHRYIL